MSFFMRKSVLGDMKPRGIISSWQCHNKGIDQTADLFLAHLSRRLIGELIVYRSSRRPCVRPSVHPSVHTFKHEYLCNQLADWNEILSEASLGWGKGFSRF